MSKNKEHTVKLNKRGAYLHNKSGGASRGGAHRKTKRALSRKACRTTANEED